MLCSVLFAVAIMSSIFGIAQRAKCVYCIQFVLLGASFKVYFALLTV